MFLDTLNAIDPISFITFISDFSFAEVNSEIHESATMWLFKFFWNGLSSVEQNGNLIKKSTSLSFTLAE